MLHLLLRFWVLLLITVFAFAAGWYLRGTENQQDVDNLRADLKAAQDAAKRLDRESDRWALVRGTYK